jgi:hypothetical protein
VCRALSRRVGAGTGRPAADSPAQVKTLFTQERAILAGWVHYLAFDFFIGCWMVMDAAERGIKHLLVVPCMLLTFMFGPVGLMLYVGLRAALGARAMKAA